jgi:hypothetical protein
MAELRECPFCGGKPYAGTSTIGSMIGCSKCGARIEYFRPDKKYKTIATARRWTYPTVEMRWNRRAGDGK